MLFQSHVMLEMSACDMTARCQKGLQKKKVLLLLVRWLCCEIKCLRENVFPSSQVPELLEVDFPLLENSPNSWHKILFCKFLASSLANACLQAEPQSTGPHKAQINASFHVQACNLLQVCILIVSPTSAKWTMIVPIMYCMIWHLHLESCFWSHNNKYMKRYLTEKNIKNRMLSPVQTWHHISNWQGPECFSVRPQVLQALRPWKKQLPQGSEVVTKIPNHNKIGKINGGFLEKNNHISYWLWV